MLSPSKEVLDLEFLPADAGGLVPVYFRPIEAGKAVEFGRKRSDYAKPANEAVGAEAIDK
jgi:hypothetical protein